MQLKVRVDPESDNQNCKESDDGTSDSTALGPRSGNMSQNSQKLTSLVMSLTKDPKPKTKNFFHCRLKDLLSLLRVCIAL